MKRTTLALLSVVFLLTTIAASTAAFLHVFYDRYEAMARHIGKTLDYDADTANAIKHATAASDMFSALRPVMGDEIAEAAVIRLGVLNEYIERVIYPNDRDSAREIMKDLHNNYAGIMAAKLADGSDAFDIIISFGANRTLIVNRIYNPFFSDKEPKNDVVAYGYEWFKEHHSEIDQRIEKKVARAKDLRAFNPIQLSNLKSKSTYAIE